MQAGRSVFEILPHFVKKCCYVKEKSLKYDQAFICLVNMVRRKKKFAQGSTGESAQREYIPGLSEECQKNAQKTSKSGKEKKPEQKNEKQQDKTKSHAPEQKSTGINENSACAILDKKPDLNHGQILKNKGNSDACFKCDFPSGNEVTDDGPQSVLQDDGAEMATPPKASLEDDSFAEPKQDLDDLPNQPDVYEGESTKFDVNHQYMSSENSSISFGKTHDFANDGGHASVNWKDVNKDSNFESRPSGHKRFQWQHDGDQHRKGRYQNSPPRERQFGRQSSDGYYRSRDSKGYNRQTSSEETRRASGSPQKRWGEGRYRREISEEEGSLSPEKNRRQCLYCKSFDHNEKNWSKCPACLDEPLTNVTAFGGEDDCLSNLYSCNIQVFGKIFRSAEHAYQYQKAYHNDFKAVARQIYDAASGKEAKKLSKQVRHTSIEWNSRKFEVLGRIIEAKVQQVPQYREALINAKEVIAEAVPYSYEWSAGASKEDLLYIKQDCWPGRNEMGKLHMNLKNKILQGGFECLDKDTKSLLVFSGEKFKAKEWDSAGFPGSWEEPDCNTALPSDGNFETDDMKSEANADWFDGT